MIKKKYVLCVIPARSGSKGIKNKNIQKINNKHLLEFTCQFASNIKYIDKTVISTDSIKYQSIAKKYGVGTFFKRNKRLSGDRISDHQVIKDALIKSEKYYKQKFDIIIYLQPTSPIRRKDDLIKALNDFISKKYDSIWSISEVDLKFNPLKQLIIENKFIKYFSKLGKNIIARQQLHKTYIRNGVFYVISRKLIKNSNSILGLKCGYYIINHKVINIDDKSDLKDFENYINENTKKT